MSNDNHVEAVKKVFEYINENIDKKMSLQEIAKVSGYSSWHISRIFKQHYNKSIFSFIRSLRLSKAALHLRDNESNVLDVALDFMFDSHEGFTRAFAKEFRINPKRYSKDTPPIKLFIPYPINHKTNKEDNVLDHETIVIFSQVIEKPKRKAIIKRAITAREYFKYCEEVGSDVWGTLCSIKEALFEPAGMWLHKSIINEGTSKYVQGVEVPFDYNGIVPEGFEIIDLDACKAMIFQDPQYDDADFLVAVGKVMKEIDKYDPTSFGFEWADDLSPRFQYQPRGERGYIEGRAVK